MRERKKGREEEKDRQTDRHRERRPGLRLYKIDIIKVINRRHTHTHTSLLNPGLTLPGVLPRSTPSQTRRPGATTQRWPCTVGQDAHV